MAFQLAIAAPSSKTNRNPLKTVMREWLKADADAAREAVEKADLDAETKTALLGK
ncbi:MAG: hypothetical protein QM755_13710 [Luteolibacter sp.]